MPRRALKGCNYAGCSNLTESGRRFCDVHRSAQNKQRDAQRGSSTDRGYGSDWQKVRHSVLLGHPICADPFGFHANEGRIVPAVEVDHILPRSQGGTDEPENLQPLCEDCHDFKTEQFDTPRYAQRYMRALIPVTIVCGPPGSGKTSYVKSQAKWGDLIIDLDAIYCALSGLDWYEKPDALLPFVLVVRDALLRQLSRESKVRHAWFITSEPRRGVLEKIKVSLGANQIMMDTSPTECVRRISQDARRKDKWQQWEKIVNRWFERHRLTT